MKIAGKRSWFRTWDIFRKNPPGPEQTHFQINGIDCQILSFQKYRYSLFESLPAAKAGGGGVCSIKKAAFEKIKFLKAFDLTPGSKIKITGTILLFVAIFLFFLTSEKAAGQKLWSDVRLNKSSVYVGEPVEVTISVYTSTWFTSGVDLGNIKVNGAFTVYFRPVSTSVIQNGQTFPGVQLIYHVFPFSEDDITFPSLNVEVETPADGDYKGVRRTLKTQEKPIRVLPVPPNFEKDQWLVTSNLYLDESWSGNLKNVKVGDVLERKITRTAYGTVSELIPPIVWDSIPQVSLYPTRSNVENHKSKTAISAIRTESMRYLFEKEGEVVIPEMVFSWYNSYQKRLYKHTLKEVKINVLPNPDLGVLTSVRDSLQAQLKQAQIEEEKGDQPFTILGLSPKRFALLVIIMLLAIYLMYRGFSWIIFQNKKRKEAYLHSEAYYFDQFKKAVRGEGDSAIIKTLYRWIDELKLDEPSVEALAELADSQEILREKEKIDNYSLGTKTPLNLDLKIWKRSREVYLHKFTKQESTLAKDWINPTVERV